MEMFKIEKGDYQDYIVDAEIGFASNIFMVQKGRWEELLEVIKKHIDNLDYRCHHNNDMKLCYLDSDSNNDIHDCKYAQILYLDGLSKDVCPHWRKVDK